MNRTHNANALRIALEKLDWFETALHAADVWAWDARLDQMRRELTEALHDAERDVADVVAPLVDWNEGTKSIAEYRRDAR